MLCWTSLFVHTWFPLCGASSCPSGFKSKTVLTGSQLHIWLSKTAFFSYVFNPNHLLADAWWPHSPTQVLPSGASCRPGEGHWHRICPLTTSQPYWQFAMEHEWAPGKRVTGCLREAESTCNISTCFHASCNWGHWFNTGESINHHSKKGVAGVKDDLRSGMIDKWPCPSSLEKPFNVLKGSAGRERAFSDLYH